MWDNVKHRVCLYAGIWFYIYLFLGDVCLCVRMRVRVPMCSWFGYPYGMYLGGSRVADGGTLDMSRGRGPYYCDWRATVKGSRCDLFKASPGNN